MIIYRAFAREAVRNTIAITLILAVVMGFLGLTALLGRAVSGDLAEDIVLRMFGLQTLGRLDLLLTLGLYLGVLFTASRWYRDSEMTVLAACGIGLTQLLRPMVVLTAIAAVAIGALGLHVTPWSYSKMEQLRVAREQQAKPVTVVPGVFNELAGGSRIFYAERVAPDSGALGTVFVAGLGEDDENIVSAHGGYTYTDKRTGDKFVALTDGTLYEGGPGEAGYRLVQFKTLHVRIEPKRVVLPAPKTESLPLSALLARGDRGASAEWQWRLSKPVSAAVLVLFALVLAYTDPRRGRLGNFFLAVLLYFIYSNLLAFGQSLIRKGMLPDSIGLWWVHAGMFVVAIHLFRQRVMSRPLFALPRWGRR